MVEAEAEEICHTLAGPEIAVATTKAYSRVVVIILCDRIFIGKLDRRKWIEEILGSISSIFRCMVVSCSMEIWFDQSSGSNREENGKAEINPCFIACK